MKATIIGCGSIGATKLDSRDYPGGKNILTHAHACYDHPDINDIIFVDIDKEKAEKSGLKWNTLQTYSYDEWKNYYSSSTDIVIIAVPTQYHYEVLQDVLSKKPKLVICEKPFCVNSYQAQKIADKYKEEKIPLVINYNRFYESFHWVIKNIIDKSEYSVLSCVIHYTRGLKHEACHALQLLLWWFDEIFTFKKLPTGLQEIENDDTEMLWMNAKGCLNICMIPHHGRDYSIFEIDLLLHDKRITLLDHGLKFDLTPISTEKTYDKTMTLSSDSTMTLETELTNTLHNLLDYCIQYLTIDKQKYADKLCKAEQAIKVHQLIERIRPEENNGNFS